MNTHRFMGDMADQIEKDRYELIRLRDENLKLWLERREFIDWVSSQCGGPCDLRSLKEHALRLVAAKQGQP